MLVARRSSSGSTERRRAGRANVFRFIHRGTRHLSLLPLPNPMIRARGQWLASEAERGLARVSVLHGRNAMSSSKKLTIRTTLSCLVGRVSIVSGEKTGLFESL